MVFRGIERWCLILALLSTGLLFFEPAITTNIIFWLWIILVVTALIADFMRAHYAIKADNLYQQQNHNE
jgi:hypothetical protein